MYEVHWVWTGNSLETKLYNMREAMVYSDPPQYYDVGNLLVMQLDFLTQPVRACNVARWGRRQLAQCCCEGEAATLKVQRRSSQCGSVQVMKATIFHFFAHSTLLGGWLADRQAVSRPPAPPSACISMHTWHSSPP